MKLFIQITTILAVSLLVGFSQTHALDKVTIGHRPTFETGEADKTREADKFTPERERQKRTLPTGINSVNPNDTKKGLKRLRKEEEADKHVVLEKPREKVKTHHGHTNDCKRFPFTRECEQWKGVDPLNPNDKKNGLISLPPKDKYVEFKKPAETPNLKKGSKFEEGTNRSIVQRYIDYYGNTPATDTCMQDICKSKYQNINTQNRCKAYTTQAYFEIWLHNRFPFIQNLHIGNKPSGQLLPR